MRCGLAKHGPVAIQLLQFAAIGGVGLFVDMGALWAALEVLGLGPYAGRLASYLVAATFTWACNRAITFKGAGSDGILGQWAKFLMVNAFGGLVNFATYAIVMQTAQHWTPFLAPTFVPYFGVVLGSAAGILLNFTATRRFVFR